MKVNVWSYSDSRLQTEQLHDVGDNSLYYALLNMESGDISRLQFPNESISFASDDSLAIIIKTNGGSSKECYWNREAISHFFLLKTYTGDRQPLKICYPNFAPGNHYIYGTDNSTPNVKNNVMIYDIRNNVYKNITEKLSIPSNDVEVWSPSAFRHRGVDMVSSVVPPKNYFLIKDQFDLWLIDYRTESKSIPITNGFGRKHQIHFDILKLGKESIAVNDTIVLSAFNEENKNQGFYRIIVGQKKDPEVLLMKSFKIKWGFPKKAKEANVFLVKAEDVDGNNTYWSTDLKTLKPLDSFKPNDQKHMSSELISWKSAGGKKLSGILYKPKDFDSNKKYPVIFQFYEKLSDELNDFRNLDYSVGRINIPWFVIRGYVVCCPDIEFEIGKPGESGLNSLISCVNYLSNFDWINKKKLGLAGHSFGGYETNYIITHSGLFAAALSASGPSDVISDYGSLFAIDEISKQFTVEIDQYRLRRSLWENPELYIQNSPIFKAYAVSTPLLMMNNSMDKNVQVSQGLEFFNALRRLGKRVWMLQYDQGDHVLIQKQDAIDYTYRVTQFFDHYLKDSACPHWMLYGISAKDKGIDNGYELVKEKDPKTGKWLTPKEGGLLTDEEKKKVEALKRRKPITVTIE